MYKLCMFYLLVDMSHANLTSEVYTSDAPLRKETPSSCKLLLTKPIATAQK